MPRVRAAAATCETGGSASCSAMQEMMLAVIREQGASINKTIDERDTRYEQRFAAVTEAMRKAQEEADLRYEQRFTAQNAAVQTAMVAAEKAVNAALIAAERAVAKAEASAEKRFEAIGIGMLMPRTEADQRFQSLSEKLDKEIQRGDRTEGNSGGLKAGWGYFIAALATASIVFNLVEGIAKP